jgi:hypothetical protein
MRDQDPADPEANPFHRVTDHWEAVVEDVHATARKYRAEEWTAVAVHPGDVTVLTGEPRTAAELTGGFDPGPRRVGFDVVVPGDEFERLRDALADRTVGKCRVFGAGGSGVVYRVAVVETTDRDVVALVPLYYDRTDLEDLLAVADEHGLATHVRPLQDDQVVTIEHADVDPFVPDDDGA